jgi:branched-chain amino acid transport system ATP-binding protein
VTLAVRDLNQKEGVSILLAEQNTNVALKCANYGTYWKAAAS